MRKIIMTGLGLTPDTELTACFGSFLTFYNNQIQGYE